ncbi:copper homeostasis protein cutc [Zalerion maritima]|uniref:Copper homeostasis protein cutC homolog n=1 Tax=Zalerion maritima TaxID=339359 RepID=A0AAD5RS50_9PEZI|nr:copper homeostasis protein cutc [Zalerion maritima]
METQIKDHLTEYTFSRGGYDGHSFIFGALKKDQGGKLCVDKEVCRRLIRSAEGMSCYFQRAIDDVISSGTGWKEALVDLEKCGFRGILTAGGKDNAVDDKEGILEMARYMKDRPLELAVGGGVRSFNVRPLLDGWSGDDVPNMMPHSTCLMAIASPEDKEIARLLDLNRSMA